MNNIYVDPGFARKFHSCLEKHQIITFTAPCGCGKTAVAHSLLDGPRTLYWSALEEGGLREISGDARVVILDDLQELQDPSDQERLLEMLRSRGSQKFVLLTRGSIPGRLMPFVVTGDVERFTAADFLLSRPMTRKFLEGEGVHVDESELAAIDKDIKGYPLALASLCRHMADGSVYSSAVLEKVKRDVFLCFDELVYKRLKQPVRRLLLSVAPLESFTVSMAVTVSGDPEAGILLDTVSRESSMLLYSKVSECRLYPIFRQYLIWKAEHVYSHDDICSGYDRAGLYYELQGDIPNALKMYLAGESNHKVSELLEKHAQLHPGVGHYLETGTFYRALPRETVLASPSLMCGMSMLSAMELDFEASEEWYSHLCEYASGLKRSDSEYRQVQGKIAYLDIGLPQRGSRSLIEVISTVFHAAANRSLELPSFSVTSTLPSIMNGGKDFCDWSRQDDLLYATMSKPVETVLGKDGIGLPDCAIAESKFEKGEDISGRLLKIVSNLGRIQNKGTPDIEFAAIGLLARNQIMHGDLYSARQAIESIRERLLQKKEDRFLPNIDAMLCRIDLRMGDYDRVGEWMREKAPKDRYRFWALWRYQYLTLAMALISTSRFEEALEVLAPMVHYCEVCGRHMDSIYTHVLMAICHHELGSREWEREFQTALKTSESYRFIIPIAQFGQAVLPLLKKCSGSVSSEFYARLARETRDQAVRYPQFLRSGVLDTERLTDTEEQVLQLVCSGYSNNEIAESMGIKLPTVKTHVSHILQKLGVRRRSEARAAAERLQLLQQKGEMHG